MIPTLILIAATLAADPVRLRPYPQKLVYFHKSGDPQLPKLPPQLAPLAIAGDGATWTAAPSGGLVRFHPQNAPADRWQYFAGRRYLPDDTVLSIAPVGAAGVWVRTETGVAEIHLAPMALASKADRLEQRIADRHDRSGFVSPSSLDTPGDPRTNRMTDDDNDGLWTAIYVAAECFRYQVTKSPEALRSAKKSLEAMLSLVDITGKPGFPARSWIERGAIPVGQGRWQPSPDGTKTWKGDTSSDEIVGHIFAYALAVEMLPDAELKTRISTATGRILDHILSNGLRLIDVNSEPTTWGRWDEAYFASDKGRSDAPLNALEILAFLKVAGRLTANPKYEAEYKRLALDRGYLALTARYLDQREEINYSDEELAMLPFYLLFRYEKDDAFLAVYRKALDQWWQNAKRENNPLWTLIYATANPTASIDLQPAAWMLYRHPIDLIDWTVKNSHRRDVTMLAELERHGRRQAAELLPPDERPVMKWNANPFVVDGGSGGRREDDGAAFLLPYWLGRYHGLFLGE